MIAQLLWAMSLASAFLLLILVMVGIFLAFILIGALLEFVLECLLGLLVIWFFRKKERERVIGHYPPHAKHPRKEDSR